MVEGYSDDFNRLERMKEAGSAVAIEIEGMPEVTLFLKPGLDDNEIANRAQSVHAMHLKAEASIEDESRSDMVRSLAIGGIVPPLVVLAIGVAVGWVLGGFRKA